MGNSSGPGADAFGEYDLPTDVGAGEAGGDEGLDEGQGDRGAAAAGAAAAEGDDGQGDEGAAGARGAARSGAADQGGDRGARRAAAGAPGADRGGKPESFPAHRFDELNAKFDRVVSQLERQLENEQLQNRRFRAALGLGAEPRRERTFNQRETRIRQQIFNLMPELAVLSDAKLAKLLERAPDLDRMASEFPQQAQSETRRWGGHAERMVRQVLNHAAVQFVGEGKTFKDLDADDRADLEDAFIRWVTRRSATEERELPAGHYGETTLRYESGDPTLISEFWTHYTRRHGAAAGAGGGRRQDVVAAAARAAAGGRTVRGGSSSAAVGSAGREVKPKTLDDALDEGWSAVQQQRAGAA